MKKGFVALTIFLICIIAGWYFFQPTITPRTLESQDPAAQGAAAVVAFLPPGGEYTNPKFHFSLQLPETYTVKEYDENKGAGTVLIEDPATKYGFQIFVTPYEEEQITPERFKMDAPSGVRKEEQPTSIDGVNAVAFFSEHSLLGETREVWFIREGFLYEITTYKPLDPWLAKIMTSWKFTAQ